MAKNATFPVIGRRSLLGSAAGLIAAPAVVCAQGQNGIALVIGNSKYQWEAQLPNVRRDVPDVARRFEQFGLKTELLQDVGHDAMRQAIGKFASAARGAKLAAFYFAGHGAQWEKTSYIVPADADLGTPSVVKTLPSVLSIREGTRQAMGRLLVFDSCRNNPADDWRQQWAVEQGSVQRVNSGGEPNAVILFSTAPGRAALDGPAGQNSPFAAALLRQLASPSVDLHDLPGKLRRDLLIATEGRQVLWDINSYEGPFPLNGPAGASPVATGGSSADRVVELPNAYAFGAKNDLFMPPGLIACRPRSGSNDGRKVGAYQVQGAGNPSMFIVMSVEDPQAVDLVWVGRYKQTAFWRFARGKISGDTIEFTGASTTMHNQMKWKDANSGGTTSQDLNNGKIYTAAFSRLDG